jgi:hypothetical protein
MCLPCFKKNLLPGLSVAQQLGQGERLPGSAAQCRCDGAERYTEALAGGRVYTKTNRRDPDADDADAPL